jgi:hypothetical protein
MISGLDLGKVKDNTVLVIAQRDPLEKPLPKRKWQYTVRWISLWPLGTKYTVIADGLHTLFESPKIAKSRVAADNTGVGQAVLDVIKEKRVDARIIPITSHGGKITRFDEKVQVWHTAKIDMVSSLQVILQSGLLHIDDRVPHVERLRKELSAYRETITRSKNQTFAADASQHDDIVSALMMMVWLGEQDGGGSASGISSGTTAGASAPDGVYAQNQPELMRLERDRS